MTLGFGFSLDTSKQSLAVSSQVVQADENNGILAFNGQKQFVMEEKDQLGRAHSAHIQLQDKDEPKNKRPGKIKYDPVGWHNYKFYYGDGKSKSWLMNRGHLIGYQFSGVNDEGKNLVPMTAWLNSGNYRGTDEGNQSGMLYYENRLDNWLALHPNYWLDYKVTAIYSGDELLPRQVEIRRLLTVRELRMLSWITNHQMQKSIMQMGQRQIRLLNLLKHHLSLVLRVHR